jgi:hypothetical protein
MSNKKLMAVAVFAALSLTCGLQAAAQQAITLPNGQTVPKLSPNLSESQLNNIVQGTISPSGWSNNTVPPNSGSLSGATVAQPPIGSGSSAVMMPSGSAGIPASKQYSTGFSFDPR